MTGRANIRISKINKQILMNGVGILFCFQGASAAKNVEANKKTFEGREPMPSPMKIANPRRHADIQR